MGWTPKELREAAAYAERQRERDDKMRETESGLLVPAEPEVVVPEHVAEQRAKDALTLVPVVFHRPEEGWDTNPRSLLRRLVHVGTRAHTKPWCGASTEEGYVFERLTPEQHNALLEASSDERFSWSQLSWCKFCVEFSQIIVAA